MAFSDSGELFHEFRPVHYRQVDIAENEGRLLHPFILPHGEGFRAVSGFQNLFPVNASLA